MKHARYALALMILLVTPLLLSGVITPVGSESKIQPTRSFTRINTPSYEEHGPIWILNDTAFDDMAVSEEWAGDGSPSTPYIIEGYNITTDDLPILNGILIQDVTVCFEIRGCYIADITPYTSYGISIFNATQASIVDTVIVSKQVGMYLDTIDSLSITGCDFTDINNEAIHIIHCVGSTIDNCAIYDSYGTGIGLYYANNSLLTHCNVSFLDYGSGIYLYNSHFVSILHNEISECQSSGIWAVSSPHSTIEDNIIHDNWFYFGPMCGVHLFDSPYAAVVGNEIYHNAQNGIYVEFSDWAYIFDNDIYDNADHGIASKFSDNVTVLQNNIHGNGWWPVMINALCGIYLGSSADWLIADNSIWNNTPSGISLEIVQRIEISNNEIFNNTESGIHGIAAILGEEIYIHQNHIYGNGYYESAFWLQGGIILDSFYSCVIVDNEVYNNTYDGISFFGENNIVRNNHIYDNKLVGINTVECYDNTISENIVHDNEYGIYVVNIGTNITDNIVYDNEYGIYMEWSGDCFIYGNDIGWNAINAFESDTFEGQPLYWHNNVSIGNWWHNYNYTGYYNISSDTGNDNVDLFPSKSLELITPASIDYEILETGNVLVWHAYAHNPLSYELIIDAEHIDTTPWDGGDIEVNVDGFMFGTHTIEIVVYHISGHYLGNASNVYVEDLTPPSDIEGPIHITISFGENISVQYSAFDPSGIDEWAVNDTVNFAIDSSGRLINVITLPVGEYVIRISVSDIFNHTTYLDVRVTVAFEETYGPTLLLIAGGAGVVILVVVILIGSRKRGT